MKIYICNAFSLSMLDSEVQKRIGHADSTRGYPRVPRPLLYPVGQWLDRMTVTDHDYEVVGAVGHPDTAALFESLLGLSGLHNRIAVKLHGGIEEDIDCALVGQVTTYDGGPYRLPPGTTELPEDAFIQWWVV